MNFNNTLKIINNGLDLTWQKQKIVSDNIANISTPGYKSRYVSFENEVEKSLKKLNADSKRSDIAKAIDHINPKVYASNEETDRLDGNNVNIEAENIELARAQIQYEYLISQLNGQVTMLQSAIKG